MGVTISERWYCRLLAATGCERVLLLTQQTLTSYLQDLSFWKAGSDQWFQCARPYFLPRIVMRFALSIGTLGSLPPPYNITVQVPLSKEPNPDT